MEIAKDIVTILGTVAAVVIGILGLKTWRVQLKTTSDNDLARRILVSLYKVRSNIQFIRRPLREAILPEDKSQFDQNATTEAFAKQYETEWNKVREEMAELEAASIEAQATWDRDFPNHLIPLRTCIFELLDYIREHLRTQAAGRGESYHKPEEIRKIIFGTGGSTDEFGQKVEEAVKNVDDVVRPRFVK